MRGLITHFVLPAALGISFLTVSANARPVPDDHDSVVLVFKDGHRQTLAMGEVASIDIKSPGAILYKDGHREKLASAVDRIEFGESGASAKLPGRSHYIGKWEVWEGNGGGRFFITLEANGNAEKSIGATHGTWALVDGQARVTWDDGWHDVIRKVGSKHEKVAYEPGKSFDDTPSNVTAARNTQPKSI